MTVMSTLPMPSGLWVWSEVQPGSATAKDAAVARRTVVVVIAERARIAGPRSLLSASKRSEKGVEPTPSDR